jgi:hypothetical protein
VLCSKLWEWVAKVTRNDTHLAILQRTPLLQIHVAADNGVLNGASIFDSHVIHHHRVYDLHIRTDAAVPAHNRLFHTALLLKGRALSQHALRTHGGLPTQLRRLVNDVVVGRDFIACQVDGLSCNLSVYIKICLKKPAK